MTDGKIERIFYQVEQIIRTHVSVADDIDAVAKELNTLKKQYVVQPKVLQVTEAEYHRLCDELAGWCPLCGELQESGDFEPDARNRFCDGCEGGGAMGIEEGLAEGLVLVTGPLASGIEG